MLLRLRARSRQSAPQYCGRVLLKELLSRLSSVREVRELHVVGKLPDRLLLPKLRADKLVREL